MNVSDLLKTLPPGCFISYSMHDGTYCITLTVNSKVICSVVNCDTIEIADYAMMNQLSYIETRKQINEAVNEKLS